MKLLNKLALILTLSISVITNANAGIIKLSTSSLKADIELGVLSLDESFESFYNYSKYSAHTGYEQKNKLVMFFAEYQDNVALFAISDQYRDGNVWNKNKGSATFTIDNLAQSGEIIFKDDEADDWTENGVNWAWSAKRTDGLIFQLDNANSFNLDIAITNKKGLWGNYQFLSFDKNNNATQHNFKEWNTKGQFNVSAIPEPTTLAVFALALFGLAAARRKA
ncbi:hypothetical protein CXF85_12275 [Colwellia sp. 75C3]|uniref:PEP-CTERM sorting domain-containing protein n=1 Tax=Colwellia sp. 75C3 TaxID=888425 RepID=UPI000C31E186|nr:PEP-CTERM sorting domain-containing protein [Colwellia sp. 75C3]PKG82901.1 hypothetical protein CXF85_12275 [Colwellia sp. 75C3]